MYELKVWNNQGCMLERRKVEDYDNVSIKAVFDEYQNPTDIHIDVVKCETDETVADYHWCDVE